MQSDLFDIDFYDEEYQQFQRDVYLLIEGTILTFLRIYSFLIKDQRKLPSAHSELLRGPLVAASKKLSKFDTKTFLSTINGGRKIVVFSKKEAIFAQGDSADAVFYVKEG
jgi:hypothetical protein